MTRTPRLLVGLVAVAAIVLLAWLWMRPGDAGVDDAAPAAETTPLEDAAALSDDPAAQRIHADLRRLADDDMQGRETGSRGHALAAAHVAARFAEAGLEPAGEDGWFQHVPLLRAIPQADDARLAVVRGGRTLELRLGEQFLPWANFNAARHALEAPAVFVGHAIHAPVIGHDDFAGLDLDGRIAVLFPGVPAGFDDQHRAFHSALPEKLAAIASRGAVGAVLVSTPESEARLPWARQRASWQNAAMRLRGDDGRAVDGLPQLEAVAAVGAAAADFIFADGDAPAAQLFDAARAGTLRGFALPGTLVLAGSTAIEPLDSRNVVARLPGSDAALAGGAVVHTAHLDHVGTLPAGGGDRVHNGAIDNALGVAIMLEAARTLAAAPTARTQLFVALTGEEQGLLGAQWFVQRARPAPVANINIDMPVLLAPSTDFVAIGREHSSLGDVVDAVAGELGVTVSPDPFPEEVAFVRSDHYAFVRAGIPAIYLDGGTISADGERDPKRALAYYLRNCYHQPCDDASQPIQYDDAARLARISAAIATRVGNDRAAPQWREGDFFGRRFGRSGSGVEGDSN